MEFITAFLNAMGTIGTGFIGFITSFFSSVVGVIYTNDVITPIGYILLFGAVVGMFWFVLGWLRKLITLRNRG